MAPTTGLLAAVVVALALAAPARGGTISVTTTFDQRDGGGPCSLREAVDTANSDVDSGGCADVSPAAADRIVLPGGDHHLTRSGSPENANASGDLDVAGDVTIAGPGAALSGIDGNGARTGDRVLYVQSGTLTISGVTIYGGAGVGLGGGILANPGALNVVDSRVTGNAATGGSGSGGGIASAPALTVVRSTISGNRATSSGGGIYAFNRATLTRSTVTGNTSDSLAGGMYAEPANLIGSTVSGNTAEGVGGGLVSMNATLTQSTVSDNSTTGTAGRGGGFYGSGTLTDSTVRRNYAEAGGGGVHSWVGSLSLVRSTVADNRTENHGGGIFFSSPGTLEVTSSTLTGNVAAGYGGGLGTDEGTSNLRSVTIDRNLANGGGVARLEAGTVNLSNTILAGNHDPVSDPEFHDWSCSGAGAGIVSEGYNLLPADQDCTVALAAGDATATDPGLGPLTDNGGTTLTQALLSTSPAINTGHPGTPGTAGACPAADQRGAPRPSTGRCDKGATERLSCEGRIVNRVGTAGADVLIGTSAADGILGLGGNDTLSGRSGNDGICGGDGDDKLAGEAGNDALNGGDGTDACNGGTESDQAVRCETATSVP